MEIIGPDPTRNQAARFAEANAPWAELPVPDRSVQRPPLHEPLTSELRLHGQSLPEPRPTEPEPRTDRDSPADQFPTDLGSPVSPDAAQPPAKGFSPAALILSCLVIGALAGTGGYMVGRKHSQGAKLDTRADNPAPTPLGATVPLKTWLPPEGKPSPGETEDPTAPVGPASVLRAFLSAPGWAARSAHVLPSEQVHQAMAVQASIHGDGPIKTTEIALLQKGENSHIFLVRTEKIPSGFPVALAKTGDGWLVDWQTFSEFFYDRFKTFAAEPSEDHETFHLLVNRGDPGADKDIATFRLNPPMPGREKVAKVRKDSTAYSALGEVFKQQEKLDPETFEELTRGQGLPLVVVLSSRGNGNGEASLWIDDVVAVGWGPQVGE